MDIDTESRGHLMSRYPAEFRNTVVRFAEKFNNREAERTFGIAESNIRRWRKLKPRLFSDGLFSDYDKRKGASVSYDEFVCVDGDVSNEIKRESTNVNKQSEMPQKSNSNDSKSQDNDEVCLRWNSHHHNMKSMFPILLQREQFVDVTLTSEGKTIKCHKLILSSCSTYFDNMLCDVPPTQHAIIFLNSVPFWLLKILVDFMYTGEVHIDQNKLQDLLSVAELLQIKGLTGKSKEKEPQKEEPQKPVLVPQKPPKSVVMQQKPVAPPVLKPKIEPKQIKVEEGAESRVASNKKDLKQQAVKIKVIKLQTSDAMPLLKPVYLEDNEADVNKTKESPKKVGVKRMKKRKSSEHESSPPPILFRKGTKSRPHVKVPKYYHNDYEDLESINVLNLLQNEDMMEKIMKREDSGKVDLDKVKTEPADIDDTEVLFTEVSEDETTTKNDSNIDVNEYDGAEGNVVVDK